MHNSDSSPSEPLDKMLSGSPSEKFILEGMEALFGSSEQEVSNHLEVAPLLPQHEFSQLPPFPPVGTPGPPEISSLSFEQQKHDIAYQASVNQLSQKVKTLSGKILIIFLYILCLAARILEALWKNHPFTILAILTTVGVLTNLLPILLAIGSVWILVSIKLVKEGNEYVIERLGKFDRKMRPGLHILIPLIDRVAVKYKTHERITKTRQIEVMTRNNVAIKLGAIIFWKILNSERVYYEIDPPEEAIEDLVLSYLSTEIGFIVLEELYSK